MTWLILLCFSIVVWLNRGLYDPSIPFLTGLFLFWLGYVLLNKKDHPRFRYLGLALPWIWSILFIFRNDLLYVNEVDRALPLKIVSFLPFFGMIIFTGIRSSARYLGCLLWIAPYFWTLAFSPEPHIDVFLSNRMGVKYLLEGLNPYSQKYPNIYGDWADYQAGYLYWPGALYLQTISEILFKDIRFILVLAWLKGAAFLPRFEKSAMLWLTIPVLAFTFEQAWLDPLIALSACVVIYGLKNKISWFWIVGAVTAASVKQYGFMIGLFALLYEWSRSSFRNIMKPALGIALGTLVVLAPFLIWNAHDFLQMTVFSHAAAQIRADALNFTAFLLKVVGFAMPPILQLLAILVGFGASVFHVFRNQRQRGLRVLPEAWAIFFGFSILFGKFAFCNYYLLMFSFWILSEIVDDDIHLNEQEILR